MTDGALQLLFGALPTIRLLLLLLLLLNGHVQQELCTIHYTLDQPRRLKHHKDTPQRQGQG